MDGDEADLQRARARGFLSRGAVPFRVDGVGEFVVLGDV